MCIVAMIWLMFFFFFFKQKTAYEMLRSLVGSEMCIRDSPGAAQDGLVGDRLQRVLTELQLHAIELEKASVLADQGVLRLGQDADQRLPIQLVHTRDHRQPADELWIMPYLSRSSGITSAKTSPRSTSFFECSMAPKPTAFLPIRASITLSRPAKAPPTMNSTLVVSIWMNSWCGCLRPPWGGTLAVVPSKIFSSACCTPSPETSRVIEGFSLLRAILSTSSI